MNTTRTVLLGHLIAGVLIASEVAAQDRPDPTRWAAAMERFDALDQQRMPLQADVVFVGSSSIRLWDLPSSFPALDALNRGFGGSHIADSTHYVRQLVLRYRPAVVVLYAGDNDINKGLTADQVVADYQAFVQAVRRELPETQILFIAIKPSLARWDKYPIMKSANDRIAELAAADAKLDFVDIATPMLGDDGKPKGDLFVEDGLHLNEAGYRVWTSVLRPLLMTRLASKDNTK